MKTQKNKTIYMVINTCFLILLLLPYWKIVSPFQFSDGIPMLNRINDLKNGVWSIPQYFFKAHGNSIHVLVYLLAFLDDILNGQSMLLLKLGVFIGMFGTGLLIAWIFWIEESDFYINLVLALTCSVIAVGTYNFDLYLPFQVVLSLSRFIFIFILYELSKKLMSDEFDKKIWFFLIILSTIVSLSHGMGMMFAGAIFYMHIVTSQKKPILVMSIFPFLVYNILQIYFNSGYGEVTTSKFFLIAHFREFVLGLFAYYGGILYQFFEIPRMVSILLGAIIFFIVTFILLYFFLKGIFGEKIPGKYVLNNKYTLFAITLLGMSFLAAVGASAFVTARIDLVASIANDPIENVLGVGRYLCFSVTPYAIGLYCILNKIKHEIKLQKIMLTIGSILVLCFCTYKNITISQKTINENNQLDANAVALLSGMNYSSQEMARAYGDFAGDWYYGVRIPKVYEQLKIDKKYIWNGLPNMENSLDSFSGIKTIGPSRIDYFESSDSGFVGVQLKCSNKPELRYSAVIDESGNVVGYVYIYRSKGFYIKNHNLYYDGSYYLKGYVKEECKGSDKLYIVNQKVNTPTAKGRICTGNLQLADLTDPNWISGVAIDKGCLLIEYTDEKLNLIANASFVGDGFRTMYDIESYDCVDGWIRIFVIGNDSVNDLGYPNTVYLYK